MTTPSSGWWSKASSLLGTGAGIAGAAETGLQATAETDAFLKGMHILTQQSNIVQQEMGLMNLQKTLVEGFAKFIKDMGKGFTMQ